MGIHFYTVGHTVGHTLNYKINNQYNMINTEIIDSNST